MDAQSRIDQLARDAASGLKDDPELWLDIRAELVSHVEEAAEALRAQGKSDEESLELALKAFGSPLDVAADLAAANRRRMKLRALARLGVRALLVPAAVAVALFVCSRLLPLRDVVAVIGLFASEGPGYGGDATGMDRMAARAFGRLPAEKMLLLRGDPSRPTEAERQRAIWEAHPDSKVYYGHYLSALLNDCNAPKSKVALDLMECELRRGETLDPDNARYGIVLATLWMRKAAELKDGPTTKGPDGKDVAWQKLLVKDRPLLDRAAAVLVEAAKKPFYKTHTEEMLRERLALLPPARRLEDQIARIAWAAGLLLPDCSMMRETARIAARYGDLLVAEGKAREAEPILDVWCPLAVKTAADAFTLIELLVSNAVVRIGEYHAVPAYEKAGRADKAAWTRARAERLKEPFDAYMKGLESKASQVFGEEVRRSGSILDNMLLPAGDPEVFAEYDLAPSRRLEQVLVEQVATSVFLVMLVGLMALAALTALRWRWAKGMASAPLLLLPDWRAMLRILVLAVLLPIAVYYAYTRWSGLAGREFGFRYLWYRFVLEMLLLAVTIVGLAVTMAGRRIRRRCESLGIPAPAPMARRYRVAFWVLTVALWACCLTFRTERAWMPLWLLVVALAALPSVLAMGRVGVLRVLAFWGVAAAVAAVVAIALKFPTFILSVPLWLAAVVLATLGVAAGWGLFRLVRAIVRSTGYGLYRGTIVRSTGYGLYRGTVARSLIPVFAAAALVIAAATHPYLASREAALVGADKALSPDSAQISFTRAESLMVERLKSAVAQAAREIEARP